MNRFRISADILFGEGSIEVLKDIIKDEEAKKILVITDKGLLSCGLVTPVTDIIIGLDIPYFTFADVMPNPTDELVNQCADTFMDKGIDLIVAIGGGSVMDASKAINILLSNGGRIEKYFEMGHIQNKMLPMVAIPTTAGTASEVTEVSVITDTLNKRKIVIPDKSLSPDYAILDPALTYDLPASISAATGMDALTHAIESYVSTLATPFTDVNARAAIELIVSNIQRVVSDGKDKEAREKMLLGSTMAGFAFNSAILGLVHGIAHPLGAHYGLAHGVANAIMLPYVMGYNALSCGEKLYDIGSILGIDRELCTGQAIEDRLLEINRSIGIPSLKAMGVKEEDFEYLASQVMKEPSIAMNPRTVIEKEVVDLLKRAYNQ